MAETITTDNKSTLLYRFLVSPELRWMRYLVLIMVLATISFNQVFIIFLDYRDILGGWIYTFTFLISTDLYRSYLSESFLALSKFLLKRHYLTYISLLSVAMILPWQYKWQRNMYLIPAGRNFTNVPPISPYL